MTKKEELLFQRPDEIGTFSGFFIDYLSQLTGGLWPVGITFMSFGLVYLSLDEYNPRKSFGAASFVSFLVVTMLVSLGAFDSSALIVSILLVVLSVVMNGGNN